MKKIANNNLNEEERRKELAAHLYSGISNIEKKEHEVKLQKLKERAKLLQDKKKVKKPPPPEK